MTTKPFTESRAVIPTSWRSFLAPDKASGYISAMVIEAKRSFDQASVASSKAVTLPRQTWSIRHELNSSSTTLATVSALLHFNNSSQQKNVI